VGTGAVILGPVTVGENAKVGAESFFFMKDIPPNCTVVGTPARIVRQDGHKVDLELPPCTISVPITQANTEPVEAAIGAAAAKEGLS
jgi:serine O-acetyltransferase